jgi:tetratricopeptide (TPR) repeat protein
MEKKSASDRLLTVRTLCAVVLLFVALPATPAADEPWRDELAELRARVERKEPAASWAADARRLLELLDLAGEGQGPEAAWLVDHLLGAQPEDVELLWRRAQLRREGDDLAGAIRDLERLIEHGPDHPLAVRARRALPALYLAADRVADSARADERLLELGIADESAVLARLAHTYAVLGRLEDVDRVFARLAEVDPRRVRFDPDLQWFAAEGADRLHGPSQAAAAMLRFASMFPHDDRRTEALLRAAEALEQLGNVKGALGAVEEAIAATEEPEAAMRARLLRARLLESLGRTDEARDEYKTILGRTPDAGTAAAALRRLMAMERERTGTRGALLMLGALMVRGDELAARLAAAHFQNLLAEVWEQAAPDGPEALFLGKLVERTGRDVRVPPGLRREMAALLERIGAEERAAIVRRELPAGSEAPEADPSPARGPAEVLVEADAAALAGEWEAACADYRAAIDQGLSGARAEWAEARLARCAVRAGDVAEARERLARLSAAEPGAPAAFEAERLLEELRGGGRTP